MSAKKNSEEMYSKNEKVLCYHVDFLYPAKITDVNRERKKKTRETGEVATPYRIHYDGWNRRHDEWVPVDRLVKATPENIAKAEADRAEADERSSGAKEKKPGGKRSETATREGSPASNHSLDSKQPKSSRASAASETNTPTTSSLDTSKRAAAAASAAARPSAKRLRTDSAASQPPASVEPEKDYGQRPEIRIDVPKSLKTALVDDWDLVTRQMKIPNNRKGPTVDELVAEYIEMKRGDEKLSRVEVDQYVENARGIKDHFNVMLGCQLLYKLERPAYAAALEEGKEEADGEAKAEGKEEASAEYGWIHLVRLFVRIGTLLAFTSWSPANIKLITAHLADFLSFLQAKRAECFSHDFYDTTTPEYQKKAWL